jgi:predicted nucleotidyltransferase
LAHIEEGLIESITRTIVEHCNPRRIILFGSYTRGDAGPDSDLDIFVEMETPLGYFDRAIAIDALFGLHAWPMDIIVYTPEEVKQWTGQVGTMLSYVEQEGRILYERPELASAISSRVAEKGGSRHPRH